MKIIFASQNQHKINEINALIPPDFEISGLDSKIFKEELPETGNTLEENALQKARYVLLHTGTPVFADDTGLEIPALMGRPGVFSARYAGEEKNATANIQKVLRELGDSTERKAYFRTVIAFCDGHGEHLFEGMVPGIILDKPRGQNGFGYDPIFVPAGFSKSFAEMGAAEKNLVSHRAKALEKFIKYLETVL